MGELACADVQTSHKTTCFLKYPMIMSLNGTMIDKAYLRLFTECRNLIPILSMEGTREHTDTRRGPGVYDVLRHTMKELREKGILFGVSVTVTKENVKDVLSGEFTESKGDRQFGRRTSS